MPSTGKPQNSAERRASRKGRLKTEYQVIVDLPDPLPVTDAELDLLERELADFLPKLLHA